MSKLTSKNCFTYTDWDKMITLFERMKIEYEMDEKDWRFADDSVERLPAMTIRFKVDYKMGRGYTIAAFVFETDGSFIKITSWE